MSSRKLVPEKDVIELMGDPMMRCWDKLQDFVEERRSEAKTKMGTPQKAYMYHFEEFVKKNRAKVYVNEKQG